MIKYRIMIDTDDGERYYTGRLDRFRRGKNVEKYSYAMGWSNKESAAKLYPESQKKAAIDMAKYHKACLETVSFEPEVLDIKDYSEGL